MARNIQSEIPSAISFGRKSCTALVDEVPTGLITEHWIINERGKEYFY